MRQRNITMSILKSLGFGRNIMQTAIEAEVRNLLELIATNAGKPMDVSKCITISVSNVICGILFQKHYSYDDSHFVELTQSFEDHFKALVHVTDIKWLPLLRFIPSRSRAFKHHLDVYLKGKRLIQEELEEHERMKHHEDPERDFVSAYKHMTGESCDSEMLLYVVRNFFIAGTDTTANAIKFSLIFMANHQEIQSKVRHEINAVIGTDMCFGITRGLYTCTSLVLLMV